MDKKAIIKKAIKDGKGGWGRGKDPRIEKSSPGFMGKVNDVARGITRLAGGNNLTDYLGSKIAKATVPANQRKYVTDNTSGKSALKSAGAVGITMGTAALPIAGKVLKGISMGAKALRGAKSYSDIAKTVKYGAGAVKRGNMIKAALKPTAPSKVDNARILTRGLVDQNWRGNIKNIRFNKVRTLK